LSSTDLMLAMAWAWLTPEVAIWVTLICAMPTLGEVAMEEAGVAGVLGPLPSA